MNKAAPRGDIFVTTTGNEFVITEAAHERDEAPGDRVQHRSLRLGDRDRQDQEAQVGGGEAPGARGDLAGRQVDHRARRRASREPRLRHRPPELPSRTSFATIHAPTTLARSICDRGVEQVLRARGIGAGERGDVVGARPRPRREHPLAEWKHEARGRVGARAASVRRRARSRPRRSCAGPTSAARSGRPGRAVDACPARRTRTNRGSASGRTCAGCTPEPTCACSTLRVGTAASPGTIVSAASNTVTGSPLIGGARPRRRADVARARRPRG